MNTEKSPRVLFVHQSSDLYGSDRVVLDVATALAQAGGEPIIVLPAGGPLIAALQARGIETHALNPLQLLKLTRAAMSPRGALRLLTSRANALVALDACVRGRRIDVVYSNTLAVLAGALWARKHRVKHLWHVHEIIEKPRVAARAFPWLVRQFSQRVVCNSNATRQWLLSHQPRLAAHSRVIWNGVADGPQNNPEDTAHTSPHSTEVQRLREAFRPNGEPLAIGLVGRINRMKGHALLLNAAEELLAQNIRDFSIVFIGSPPPGQDEYLDRLRQRVALSPLAQRVVFCGFLADPRAAYAALDIVCAPSTEAEAFGLVAVEAMAAGRPVIAARIGGLPEVVLHEQSGLLHQPGDATDLAHTLARLIRDDPQRAAFGREGRQRFELEFTLEAMNTRVMTLLAHMTHQHP